MSGKTIISQTIYVPNNGSSCPFGNIKSMCPATERGNHSCSICINAYKNNKNAFHSTK